MAELLTTTITGGIIQESGTTPVISAGVAVNPHIGEAGFTSFTASTIHSEVLTYNVTANKIVVAYRDGSDSDKGKAIVGTLSDLVQGGCSYTASSTALTISGGSNYLLNGCGVSGTGIPTGTTIASTGPFVLSAAATQTVSNGTLTFTTAIEDGIIWGTPFQFSAAGIATNVDIAMATLPGSAKVVIAWSDGTNGTSKVGTISGLDITFGAEGLFENSSSALGAQELVRNMSSDTTNNRVMLAWTGYGASAPPANRVLSCTTTNTDATVTTATTAALAVGNSVTGTGIPNYTVILSITNSTTFELNKVATASGTNNLTFITNKDPRASCGTVSGTTITWNTSTAFEATTPLAYAGGAFDDSATVYDATADKFVIAWETSGFWDPGRWGCWSVVGTVDGSNLITFGSPQEHWLQDGEYNRLTYDASAGAVVWLFYARKDELPLNNGNNGAMIRRATVRAGTISGSGTSAAITFGKSIGLSDGTAGLGSPYIGKSMTRSIIYDPSSQKTIAFYEGVIAGGGFGEVMTVCTVTGTTISLGARVASPGTHSLIDYDSVAKKMFLMGSAEVGGHVVHMKASAITIDLSTGGIFTLDLQNTDGPGITSFTVSNVDQTTTNHLE